MAGNVKGKPFSGTALMILSFHPCFVADAQVILADRKLNAEDRRLIRAADAIIFPQTCSLALYKACSASKAFVFPDYGLRFKYPGKVGQTRLFEKFKIPHPRTTRWRSVKEFRDSLNGEKGPPQEIPFFFKTDKSHEGEGVLPVTDKKSLETGLARLEKEVPGAFISQEMIPCGGNVLRAVVLYKKIITYWKRPDKPNRMITSINQGSRVDKKWKPELQEKGRAQAQRICEETGINLAAFDFVFNMAFPNPRPFILEINYYFGRRGLGGSLRYYRFLLRAIQEWLKEKGLDAEAVELV
jgi:ribosomal protein S6--L-glutamate ligase